MFLSVSRAVEDSVEEGIAQFVFKRNSSDDLHLIGYVITISNETRFFEMVQAGTVRETTYFSSPIASERDDAVVLVASGRAREERSGRRSAR